LAVEPSDTWLLLDAERPAAHTLEAVLAKVAPEAVLAAITDLHPHRTGLEVHGLDRWRLRALGEALVGAGVAQRYWPGFERDAGARGFFDDQLTVAFEGAATDDQRAKLHAMGITLGAVSPLPGVHPAWARDDDAIGAALAAEQLAGVRWAEPDLLREVVRHQNIPNDPEQGRQWHLNSANGRGDVNADTAWATTTGSPETIVGVFEVGGFDMAHPDLEGNIVGGFDWADGDDDPSAECRSGQYFESRRAPGCPDDQPYFESHGTAVAGLIGARTNGRDGVGVCPDCSLYLVRMSAREALRSINAAGAYRRAADDGVAIINNSWGPAENASFPLSVAEREAFDYISLDARDGKGVALVFSAGNVFQPATNNPYNAYQHSIVISASTRVDDFACYSSYGEVIDLAGPSMGCFRDEPGVGTTDISGPGGYDEGAFTDTFSGTSAAAPIVTGVAGLVLSANPDITAQQLRLILQAGATKITADKHDWNAEIGRSLAQEFAYNDAGFSLGFGYGRVDAAGALAALEAGMQTGAICDAACPQCIDDRCAPACDSEADCAGASKCLPTDAGGMACQIPGLQPTDIGAACTDACDVCVATYDTEPRVVQICSTFCEADAECPFGFDCRTVDPQQPKACVRGHQTCGARWGSVRCDSETRADNADGDRFCSCRCVQGSAGACPVGFKCGSVVCQQAFDGLRCSEARPQDQPTNAPHCVPDEAYRKACEAHADCPTGEHCLDATCQPDTLAGACPACATCTTDTDCGPEHQCLALPGGWRCTRACEADADCAGDSVCRDVAGQEGLRCVSPGDDRIEPCAADWRCTAEGRCQSDDDCDEGACTEGFCPGAEPELPADMGPPEADAEVVTVLPADEGDGSTGCATGGHPSSPLPWLALLLLGLPAVRRREHTR
jgi:MYXO-CTERM domain-containing protein